MNNKKIVQSIALVSSVTLVGFFIAYRSGFFDKHERVYPSTTNSVAKSNIDSLLSSINIEDNKNDTLKKDNQINFDKILSTHPSLELFFDEVLKGSKISKDTIEVDLPDSLFLVNDTTVFIKNNLVNKIDFENYMHNNLILAYKNKITTRLSSSKSMPVFYPEEKLINFKNLKFNYSQTIPEKLLLKPNLFKSSLNKIWTAKKLNGFSLTPNEANENLFKDSGIKMSEMMLSSKTGYIISKEDLKINNVKNIMSSSKSRIIFSKEDLKKDTIKNMMRSSKSSILFSKEDLKKDTTTFINKDSIKK
jgi:hypothetical protein